MTAESTSGTQADAIPAGRLLGKVALLISRKLPIRMALVIPFFLIIAGTVGLSGYLTLHNGTLTVHVLATRLIDEIGARTQERLLALIEQPHRLNEVHANAFALKQIDPYDVRGQERHFWRHLRLVGPISHSFFGNAEGDFVGARLLDNGSVGTMLGDASTNNNQSYHYYSTDSRGYRSGLILERPKTDPRTRPWYKQAIKAKTETWSQIYTAIDDGSLGITAVRPIYNENGVFQGVLGASFDIDWIHKFLNKLEIGKTGELFIVERSGLLVSSSTTILNTIRRDGKIERIRATESPNKFIQQTGKYIESQFVDFQSVKEPEKLEFDIDGDRHYLHILPLLDDRGLNWVMVIGLPQSDCMEQISANNRSVFIILAVALLLSIAIGIFVIGWVLGPINRLNNSALALAQGEWKQAPDTHRRDELGQLARTFNRMAENIHSLLQNLRQNVSELNLEVEHRKKVEEQLSESEAGYRNIMESFADPLYICSSDFTVEYMNPAMVHRTGRDATGERCYHSIHGLDSQCEWCVFNPDNSNKTTETNIRSPLDDRHYRVTNMPIRNQDGTISKMTIFRDITDYINAISEKEKVQAQLIQSQKMESIGNLAGGIAHDFNNILSSIIGFTELALDDVEKDSIIEDNLQEVYTAGKRAKELVAQILAFARQSEEELKPIQVDVIVKEVLQFIRSSIPTTIEINKNIDSDSLIMGNQTQVHQIIMNLCTNAAYAMEDEGGSLNVSLKDIDIDRKVSKDLDLKPGNYIELIVTDAGTGIPSDIIDSIFEPYFTTKETGEGTGMGLAMVQGIVESYGGKIIVSSIIGEGATFKAYLPVTRKRKIQRQYEPERLPTGTERILIVDDEAPIAKMGAQGLERLGYQVTTRTNSIEALELFSSKPIEFDLVITDMTMPNMTGDILAAELMTIRPDIPVILCTGYSKKISNEMSAEIGIKAIANKPIVKADLAKTVRKVLDEANG